MPWKQANQDDSQCLLTEASINKTYILVYFAFKTTRANAQMTHIQNSHQNLMNKPPLSPLTSSHDLDLWSRSFWVSCTCHSRMAGRTH